MWSEDCVKRDLGGEWRTTTRDRSGRLVIENTVRDKMTATMVNITPNDRDTRRTASEIQRTSAENWSDFHDDIINQFWVSMKYLLQVCYTKCGIK